MPRPLVLFALIALAAEACQDKAAVGKHAAPTNAAAAASSEPARGQDDPPAPPPATATAGALSSAAPVGLADRPHSGKKPRAPVDDGAATARLVFERAQKAFAENDDAVVFHCVAPATRKSWLGSMVFAGEFATMGRTKEQGARRAALDELRAILDRYGATLSVDERLAGLSLDGIEAALVRKVDDPTGLFADLLGWAARQGSRTDPMQALAEPWSPPGDAPPRPLPRALTAQMKPGSALPASDGGAGANGIAGVLGRLTPGATVGEMKVVVDVATAVIKRDGAARAGDVQRFVRQGGAWFLDE